MGEKAMMSQPAPSRRLLLVIAYIGFISLGLPDTLIGVAWPSVRETFRLQQHSLSLIFVAAGVSYFLSSFFTGRLLRRLGIGSLLATSSALVALSAGGFACAPIWPLFAGCSLLHGLGSGAIDAGLNHYVSRHFSARNMQWLHACYSVGAMLGPLLMTAALVRGATFRAGYLVVAGLLAILAFLFALTHRLWRSPANGPSASAETADEITMGAALRHPTVWLQVVLFFFYTGLEVTVGQWSFTLLTEARGVSQEAAGLWVTSYWASIAAGRLLMGLVVERLGVDRLLRLTLLLALAGAVLFACNPMSSGSAFALAIIGFGLAPVYPCMMTRTGEQLGQGLSSHAVGFQVSAAMIGVAVLPSLAGFLSQRVGLSSLGLFMAGLAMVLLVLHTTLVLTGRLRAPTAAP